jgi:membrane-associated phospholipid phosphatase
MCGVAAFIWSPLVGAQTLAPAPAEAIALSQETIAPSQDDESGARKLLGDVLDDYKNFFTLNNALWLGVGGSVSLGLHAADDNVHQAALDAGTPILWGGDTYGSQIFQTPVAIGVWVIGHAAGSDNLSATGRDLLRAQLAVFSWTNAIKWAVGRTRPNGDPRSFPSGHSTASFATAAVVLEHYGWKAGVPALLAAAYTGASRLTANQHWLSDVAFGAALGMVCGRTVTVRLRNQRVAISPAVQDHAAVVVFRVVE